MNVVSKSFALSFALVLGACSHYSDELSSLDGSIMKAQPAQYAAAASPQDIAPAAGATGATSTSIGSYLAREYYDLAKYENDKAFDYKAAKMYTGKAVAASKGQITAPSRVSSYDVAPEKIAELNQAREALITALRSENMAGNEVALAKAQTSFDCWLERSEEAADEAHYASCKSEYEQAMAQLVMPAAGSAAIVAPTPATTAAQMAEVAFSKGTSVIEPSSTGAIDQVASFLSSPEGKGLTAVVTGFTEMANPSEANRQLASSRVLKVREILMKKGIQDAVIKAQIAPVPQLSNVIPVAGGVVNDQRGLDRKVQIHLVATSVAAPVAVQPVTTTTTIVPSQPQTAPAPTSTKTFFKPSTKTYTN